jgi:hypothetical protein
MSTTDADPDTTRSGRRRGLELRHFAPLAGFVLPTVVIGYGVVIPRSCIAGLNELTLGFAATVAGACLTYWAGLRLVARDGEGRNGEA